MTTLITVSRTGDYSTLEISIDDFKVLKSEPLHTYELHYEILQVAQHTSRSNANFSRMTLGEIYTLLFGYFYGGYHELLDEIACSQQWRKHLVSLPIPAKIAHHVFIVSTSSTFLLVGTGYELKLVAPADDFETALAKALAALE